MHARARARISLPSIHFSTSGMAIYRSRQVGRDEYRLYTHSFLGLGQDEARDTYNSMLRGGKPDPCLQAGYVQRPGERDGDVYRGPPGGSFVGSGDYEGCREAVKRLVLEGGDRGGECWTPPCSIGGVHQPSFWGSGSDQVVAFEHFRLRAPVSEFGQLSPLLLWPLLTSTPAASNIWYSLDASVFAPPLTSSKPQTKASNPEHCLPTGTRRLRCPWWGTSGARRIFRGRGACVSGTTPMPARSSAERGGIRGWVGATSIQG